MWWGLTAYTLERSTSKTPSSYKHSCTGAAGMGKDEGTGEAETQTQTRAQTARRI